MKILLTGATGFLGKNLLKRLLDDGASVRALARNPQALGVSHERLEVARGDLTDDKAVAAALKGVQRVYHVAAAVKEWVRDWSVFQRVNVDGWESLIKSAMSEGVERIVYTSSFMALGHSDARVVADETLVHEPEHYHNPYERTKHLGSRISEKYIEQGTPIVTVMPGVIFGPGELTDGNIVVKMIIEMAGGKFPGIPGDGKKQWTYSFVEDVVSGHLLAMEKGRIGEKYFLGGDNVDLNRFVESAAKELGIRVPSLHIPLWILSASAFLMEQVAKITGSPPMLTVGKVGVLGHHWAYSSQKAISELGYQVTPFDDALGATIDWLRRTGRLNP
jgi:NAD+-dependent farnesol dehydrogenase